MAAANAISNILQQVFDEFGSRLSIDGGSNVLVSSPEIARALYTTTESIRTPFGPLITVTSQETPDASAISTIPNSSVVAVDSLKMDHYTHAVFGIASEDPKYILAGLKHMIYAMRPKGYAVVISLRQESKKDDATGEFTVGLEDKMKYQSKGKIENLNDVLEFAGFERGRIRTFERTASVGGKEVQAEVLLAMKWDQLTA